MVSKVTEEHNIYFSMQNTKYNSLNKAGTKRNENRLCKKKQKNIFFVGVFILNNSHRNVQLRIMNMKLGYLKERIISLELILTT